MKFGAHRLLLWAVLSVCVWVPWFCANRSAELLQTYQGMMAEGLDGART